MNKHISSFLMSVLIVLAFSPITLSATNQPGAAQGSAGLIGSKFGDFTLDVQDVNGFSPVCQLIASYNLTGFWFPQLEGSPLLERPEYRIAKQVKSFHHYCRAEVARSRYYRERDPARRNYLAKQVVAEIDFVISHPEYRPPDWPYLATMLVERGKGRLLLKDQARAVADFTEALRLDSSNKDAYLALSNVHDELGQKAKALEYATEGLRHHPTSVSLQRRYQKLGGKLPYPSPYVEPVPVETAGQNPSNTVVAPQETQAVVPIAERAPASSQASSSSVEAPIPEGDGKKPYCRFCPQ